MRDDLRRYGIARVPRLEFGPGSLAALPGLVAERAAAVGSRKTTVAVVTGGSSFRSTARYGELMAALASYEIRSFSCPGEPAVDFVDAAARSLAAELSGDGRNEGDLVVVGIGGGSAMDGAKAIAAVTCEVLRDGNSVSVADYLEGVGSRPAPGRTAYCIAVPTTAGTGSEATKNAVISRVGPGGFKKSLRHESYVPAAALVDPELAVGCPPAVSAASGLDALTQLLESYLSPRCSPPIAALCESGFEAFARSFTRVLVKGSDLQGRSGMAYAAWASGVALANAGLGSVHALASPLGARYPIPHGLVCALLLGPATDLNIRRLSELAGKGSVEEAERAKDRLAAYARAGRLLSGEGPCPRSDTEFQRGIDALETALANYAERAALPCLSAAGVESSALGEIAAAATTKTNPVNLGSGDYEALLRAAF